MASNTGALTLALTGALPMMLIVSAILALVVSLILLRRYRRAVAASMRTSVDHMRPEEFPLETAPLPVQTKLEIMAMNGAAPNAPSAAAAAAYNEVMAASRRAARVYTLAGICFALLMAAAFLAADQRAFIPIQFVYLFWIFAWPLAPTIYLLLAATRHVTLMIVAAYFLALALISSVAIARNPEFTWTQALVPWLVYNLPATLLLSAFLNRKIRAVGPLVMTFTLIVIAGAFLTTAILYHNDPLLKWVIALGAEIALSGDGLIITILVSGTVLFTPLGWLVFRVIKKRYARKKISDQSLTLDTIWLWFGIAYSIYLAFAAPAWFLSGPAAFFLYKIITTTGFALLRRALPQARKLLLLRVFSLGKRSEQLFDVLGARWRSLGSIQMIAGPDLATTNIEPHEFMDFLSGKLARRFITAEAALVQRLAETDFTPDHDRRFRVNEFFCYRDTWKMTLTRLVQENHAVLMDLRGFSPRQSGCIFEINELINAVPLQRVLFVIDDTTDEPFLRQTAQKAWQHMRSNSPNRLVDAQRLRLFRLRGLRPREPAQLLRAVCAAAHPA